MDKRNNLSITLTNGIYAYTVEEGETLCLLFCNPDPHHTWDINIGDWDTNKLLDFLKECNTMYADMVDLAFQYDDQFNEGIEKALSKARKNKIFDTGCTSYVELANQLLAEQAFGAIMTIVDDSVDCKIMAELLQEKSCIYRDGKQIYGGYFQRTSDSHIIGYIDE